MGRLETTFEPLPQGDLVQGLTGEQAAMLARIARRVELVAREHLFRLGETADSIYQIERGRLELTLPLPVGGEEREIVIEELTSGESLAWSALIPPHVLTMSARASADSTVVGFARAELLRLFEECPLLGYRVMANLAAVVGRRLHVTRAMWVREVRGTIRKRYG